MKFLCLHGMGTHSQILEAQLAPILGRLEQGHEFIFVDGEIECDAAQGVDSIFPGPYLCYYNLPTHELVKAAHDQIQHILDDEGPFDGVIGFSQGAALAASMILQNAKKGHAAKPLFKVAIFAGASLPYNLDDEKRLSERNQDTSHMPSNNGVPLGGQPLGYPTKSPLDFEKFLGRYFPGPNMLDKVGIDMPALHIVGRQDPFISQSQMLVKLCMGEKTVVEHAGGHRFPVDRQSVQRIVTVLERMIHRESFRC